MSPAPDVIVIGAGVIGAACARALAQDGARVVVLERHGGWGTQEACSWGNAGLIVPSHAAPIASPANLRVALTRMAARDASFAVRLRPSLAGWLARFLRASSPARAGRAEELQRGLAVDGLERLRELAQDGLDFRFRQDGCLNVHTGPGAQEHADAEMHSAAGRALGAQRLSAAETAATEPALAAGVPQAGVMLPGEAHCDPVRLVRALGEQAVAAGVTLTTGVKAVRLRRAPGGVAVETSVGRLLAGNVVVAAGAWSAALARDAGVPLPLQGGKGYTLEWPAADLPLRRPVYLHTERAVATPMGDRVRMTGGMVLEGLDERLDPRRVAALRNVARRCFALEGAPRVAWRGLRPCTPDGLPVIGAHPEAPEIVFATGHGMLGVTLGPLTGAMVADVLAGRAADPRLALLSPGRFGRVRARDTSRSSTADPESTM